MKRKYVFFLTISIPISYFFYFLNSSYVQSNSFQTEKTVNNVDLNFIANIDQNGKLNNDCFAFFITNKYSITTIDCAHDSLTTIKKLDNPLEGNDYYKKGSNGLLLNSVIKPATKQPNFSIIYTEKFINQFVNVNFNYNIKKNVKYYIPVVINKELIYIYTAILDENNGIVNFNELPENCEILAGSPIFTQNFEKGIGVVAMVTQHHFCKKNNSLSVVRITDIAPEIKKITNCVSYYFNLPGYIDNIGKCNFSHHS